ncbi:MAG: hypothetical protein ACRDWF_09815 [Acidimicrobiia bacterium]
MTTDQTALMRRIVVILGIVLVACGSEAESDQAFCDQAVPLLQEEIGPEEPAALRNQMEQLAEAAESLPDDQKEELLVLIDDLVVQLRLAERGQLGPDGYSSMDVVGFVSPLCGREDLIGWMVMP